MAGFFIPGPEARLEAQTLIAALGSVATPRERELLSLIATGASREEAAALLGMSRKTVDVHCSNLRQKWRAL
jgi:DNA-binding CsgD family transcriptional regulator